jgi:hypothetical protein
MQNDGDAVLSSFVCMCCAVQYVVHTPFDLQYQLAVVAIPITAISRLPIPRLSGWSVGCSSGNLTESGPGPYSTQARESRSGQVYHVRYSTSSDLTSRTTISRGLRGLRGPLDLGLGGFQVPVSEILSWQKYIFPKRQPYLFTLPLLPLLAFLPISSSTSSPSRALCPIIIPSIELPFHQFPL